MLIKAGVIEVSVLVLSLGSAVGDHVNCDMFVDDFVQQCESCGFVMFMKS